MLLGFGAPCHFVRHGKVIQPRNGQRLCLWLLRVLFVLEWILSERLQFGLEEAVAVEEGGECYVEGIASTEAMDLDGEIVDPGAIQRALGGFSQNGTLPQLRAAATPLATSEGLSALTIPNSHGKQEAHAAISISSFVEAAKAAESAVVSSAPLGVRW